MKEGNSVRLFQAEAFLGRKISAKACFSYLLKVRLAPAFAGLLFGLTAIGAYFATAAVWAYGFLCGVFLSAAYLQNGMGRSFILFFWLFFPQIFPLPCRVISDGCCVQPDGRDESPSGGIQKKEYFCFGVRYFFALILLLWGILLESYVNPWFLAKIL